MNGGGGGSGYSHVQAGNDNVVSHSLFATGYTSEEQCDAQRLRDVHNLPAKPEICHWFTGLSTRLNDQGEEKVV